MSETEPGGLVTTDRGELRERIRLAGTRFERLARAAEPHARSRASLWSVQELVAHVLTVAHRYQQVARGEDFLRAANPRDLGRINQVELEAAMAPVPELLEQLRALGPRMDAFFDSLGGASPAMTFHGGARVSGLTAQTNWLGELLLHGEDIARASRVPTTLDERDMLLVARGLMEIGHGYVRAETPADTDACFAFQVPTARPYIAHVRGNGVEIRPRRPDDRPDAELRMPASALTLLIYQRIGPLGATRRGLRIVGGRRPWLALKFQSYFERP